MVFDNMGMSETTMDDQGYFFWKDPGVKWSV